MRPFILARGFLRNLPFLRPVLGAFLLGFIVLGRATFAEPPPAPAAKNGNSTAQTPAIPAQNVVELRRRVGEAVVVRGKIARTSTSQGSGHQFLNFDASELTAVCFAEDIENFADGAPAERYRNRSVELKGKVELYRGKLQIKLREPSQIQIVEDEAPGDAPKTKSVTLKETGPEAWISPAGLHYQGRDPDGRTRLDHVRRHMQDDPERDGSHGVFDGEEAEALGAIDEAWQIVKSKKLSPQIESGRSAYTVSLGRRIGYLGGRTGADRGHPPLSRVFIVVEEGTSNLVTAFPR